MVIYFFNLWLRISILIGNYICSALLEIERFLAHHLSEAALIAVPAISVAMILPIIVFLADNNSGAMYSFDKNVIFRKILNYKCFIGVILINSLVLLFDIKIISFACAIVTLIVTATLLARTYKWFCSYEKINYKMTYRQMLRIEFLESLNNPDEILETWNMILSDEELLEKNQVGLIDVFIKTSEKLPKSFNDLSKSTFLRMLSQNISKINLSNIEVFKRLLIYSEDYYFQKQLYEEKHGSLPIAELKSIFIKLLHLAIDKNNNYIEIYNEVFFNEIQEFSEKIDTNKFNRDFLRDLFHELERSEADIVYLWNCCGGYLRNITVTRNKLEDKLFSASTSNVFGAYLDYAFYYIQAYDDLSMKSKYTLEKITECVLRNADPVFWFDMMTFCRRSFSQYPGKNMYYSMVLSWCRNGRNYGLSERLQIFDNNVCINDTESWKKDSVHRTQEQLKKETMEAAFLIGRVEGWLRDSKECKKVLSQIRTIEAEDVFQTNSKEYDRLMLLRERFNQMLKFIGDEEKKQSKKNQKHKYKLSS